MTISRSMEERFWDHVNPEPNTGCWLWDGYADSSGYGGIWDGKRLLKAHRVSWKMHKGEIPVGLQVLHDCDVPPCVNPDHLSVGTHADNMTDKKKKGRAKGINACNLNGRAKLTQINILDIRTSMDTYRNLGKKYRVHSSTISRIRGKQIWRVQ